MKTIKLFILTFITTLLVSACGGDSSRPNDQNIDAPTSKEIDEFTEAANKVADMLKPKAASLSFVFNGVHYRLDEANLKVGFIPFTMFKPANMEEGEPEEESLIWMQGIDVSNDVEITFSVSLNQKFDNGAFQAHRGELVLVKDGATLQYSVKDLWLNISNLQEKKFNSDLSAYSLDISFNGTLAKMGARKEAVKIESGQYSLRY